MSSANHDEQRKKRRRSSNHSLDTDSKRRKHYHNNGSSNNHHKRAYQHYDDHVYYNNHVESRNDNYNNSHHHSNSYNYPRSGNNYYRRKSSPFRYGGSRHHYKRNDREHRSSHHRHHRDDYHDKSHHYYPHNGHYSHQYDNAHYYNDSYRSRRRSKRGNSIDSSLPVNKQESSLPAINHNERQPQYDDEEGHYIFEMNESLTPEYKILNFMGEGTFAKVVECWDRTEKKRVAVKIVRSIEKYTEAAEIEIEILNDLKKRDPDNKHNCIQIGDSFMYRGHMCIVFPKLGLSLYDFMKNNDYKGFKMEQVKELSYKLIQAIAFLHSFKLIHTDLKPENILLVSSDHLNETVNDIVIRVPKSTEIRVIDFGSATYNDQYHSSIISTRHYRAPEVILGMEWTYPADIWSVGCILVELLTGEAIFQTHENREHLAIMEKLIAPLPRELTSKCSKHAQKYFRPDGTLAWPEIASNHESEEFVSKCAHLREQCKEQVNEEHKQFYDLVMKLLAYVPQNRLTAADALAHPFFASMHKKEEDKK